MDNQRCVECGSFSVKDATYFELETDEDHAAVLEHYLEEHPESDVLREVIESTWVELDCQECGDTFYSPLKVGEDSFHAENFCTRCANHFNPVKQLVVRDLDAEEVLEKYVDPMDADNDIGEWHLQEESGVSENGGATDE